MEHVAEQEAASPCACQAAGWCERFHKVQGEWAHSICRGEVLTLEACAAYRANWAAMRVVADPQFCPHLGEPGEPRRCGDCRGQVFLKTFVCLHPAQPLHVTLVDCRTCPHRPAAERKV